MDNATCQELLKILFSETSCNLKALFCFCRRYKGYGEEQEEEKREEEKEKQESVSQPMQRSCEAIDFRPVSRPRCFAISPGEIGIPRRYRKS